MEEDLQVIQQMAGFEFVYGDTKLVKLNESPDKGASDLTRKFMEQLDPEQLNQVYKLFKVDFEMFGYDPIL